MVHLLVAVDDLGDLVKSILRRAHRRERRGTNDWRIEHRSEPPEHAALSEIADAVENRVGVDVDARLGRDIAGDPLERT